MDRNELLTKINLTRGFETQSRQLSEEVGELLQAVNKLWRDITKNGTFGCPKEFTPNIHPTLYRRVLTVSQELADVLNMVEGLAIILHCEVEMKRYANLKLEREYERLCGTISDKH